METRKAHHQRENELCKCWSEMRNQKHAPPAIPNNDNPGQNPVHQAPTSVPCFQDRAKLFSDPGPLLAVKKEPKWRQSSKTGCSPTTVTKCHVTQSGIRLRVNRCVYNCRIENCPAWQHYLSQHSLLPMDSFSLNLYSGQAHQYLISRCSLSNNLPLLSLGRCCAISYSNPPQDHGHSVMNVGHWPGIFWK